MVLERPCFGAFAQSRKAPLGLCVAGMVVPRQSLLLLAEGGGLKGVSPFSSVTKGQQYFSGCFFELQAVWLQLRGSRLSLALACQSCCWAGP